MKTVISKAIVLFFVILLIVLSTTACGNNNSTTPNNDSKPTGVIENNSSSDVNQTECDDAKTTSKLLPYTYKVPMENIYVDVPNYQEIEEGLTQLYIQQGIKYVAITANWKAKGETGNLEEAHEKCFDKFKTNMTNYQGGVNELNISSSEQLTVNGIDMYRFEGSINYGTQNKYNGMALGYTFVIDDIPCEIIGSVVDANQDAEVNASLTTLIEEMIKTVRTSE